MKEHLCSLYVAPVSLLRCLHLPSSLYTFNNTLIPAFPSAPYFPLKKNCPKDRAKHMFARR